MFVCQKDGLFVRSLFNEDKTFLFPQLIRSLSPFGCLFTHRCECIYALLEITRFQLAFFCWCTFTVCHKSFVVNEMLEKEKKHLDSSEFTCHFG